ncbi:MAG: ligand-binding sensor domain-containing protein, partial [Chloroflexota bacterium]
GTAAGVSRLVVTPRGPGWEALVRPRAPLPSNRVTRIVPGQDGDVWIATDGGLARYSVGQDGVSDGVSWRVATVENSGLPYPTVLGLAVDDRGVAWAATGSGGAMIDPRGSSRAFTNVNAPLLHQILDAVYLDPTGRVWFGGAGGVNVYQPPTGGAEGHWPVGFNRTSTAGALPHNQVYAIFGDRQGRVWFGTAGGAAVLTPAPDTRGLGALDPARWQTFNRPTAPLAHDSVHAIAEDQQGRIWLGTKGGITVLDEAAPADGRWRQFGAGGAGALPHPWVQALVFSPDGRVWAGTRGGLAVYDPAHPSDGWRSYRAHPIRRWTGYLWPDHWRQHLLSDDVTSVAWAPSVVP